MKSGKWILLVGLTLFFALGILAFKPVPTPGEIDCLSYKGLVTEISESGTKDVAFKLKGSNKTFYVNRGLERGLDLDQLRGALISNEIVIKYPKYWTPLDPANSIRHISKIEFNGETIFTELTH